ncbi:hypothetical protein BB427_22725 [Pseudoalteromonas sp. BMB]|uniref:hypothetical protein n=1 Tax=Pseudoalteromonas sp. BMB TaxID=1874619 RepID=UPI00083D3CDB|nr:hypothetical protein [Pseudoalteromonas sp. BMB]ODB33287.1 hypothetical protein BB427_22725 [Pseudoalteromonas sp. BMB]
MSDLKKLEKATYKVYFQDGDHQITCCANALNCTQYVFVDDVCVSQKRHLLGDSTHKFTFADQAYEARFCLINGFTFETECLLLKGKKILGRQSSTPLNDQLTLAKVIFTFMGYGLVAGFCIFTLAYYLGRWYGSAAL